MTQSDIDKLYSKINTMAVDVAEIKTKLDERDRPCPDHLYLRREFDAHLLDKSKSSDNWRQAVAKGVVDIAKIALVGGFLAWWAMTANGGA